MPTISQRIALEGGEEIRRQLQAMGRAGSASFEEIEAAGIKAAQGLDRVVGAVRRVEVAFATLGAQTAAFGARFSQVATNFGAFESALTRVATKTTILTGILTAAAVAVVKFGVGAAQAGDDLGESAQAIGASVADYQKLRAVFADAGIAEEQFAQVMGKFATETAEAAKLQQKAIEDSVIKTRDALQAKGVRLPLDELRKSAEGTGRLAEDAAERLEAAGIRSVASLDKLREAAKLLGPEGDRARERLQRLGITFVGIGDAASRIIGPVSEASNILVKYGIAARDAAGNEIPLIDRVRALAVELDKLPDGFEKTAAARVAFGRGGLRAVAALADFDRQLKATNALLERYGIVVTQAETETSSRFATSLVVLGEGLSRIRTKIGAAFAPLLQLGTEAITNALVRQFGSVEGAIEKMANTVRPIIVDLVLLLNGQDINPQGLVARVQTQVIALITILRGAFNLIIAGANQVADALNAVFGTKFTGPALLAAAAVLKFLGVFALVGGAIKLVTSSIGLLVSGLLLLGRAFAALGAAGAALRFAPLLLAGLVNLPALIVVALAGLTAVFLTNRDEIIKIWQGLEPAFAKVTKAIVDAIKKDLGIKPGEDVFGWITRALDEELTKFEKSVIAFGDRIVALLGQGRDIALTWISDAFTAAFDATLRKAQEFIDKVKRILAKSPVQGGQISDQGALTPQRFTGGGAGPQGVGSELLPGSPESENIDDRRIAEINAALTALGTAAEQATAGLQGLDFSSIATGVDSLNTTISLLADSVQSLDFSGMTEGLSTTVAAAQQLGTDLQNLGFLEVAAAMQEVVAAANSAAQALSSIQTQGGDGGGFVGGGMIRGPGTSTSDSILARLSRGEYVVRAAAVRHYGPALLSAINSLRIPRPIGFNLGGLVDGMQRSLSALVIPGFAEGGLADLGSGGGRPIALTINAGGERQTFHLWADEQVADSVLRYATKRQVASAGRKSGAFG